MIITAKMTSKNQVMIPKYVELEKYRVLPLFAAMNSRNSTFTVHSGNRSECAG